MDVPTPMSDFLTSEPEMTEVLFRWRFTEEEYFPSPLPRFVCVFFFFRLLLLRDPFLNHLCSIV